MAKDVGSNTNVNFTIQEKKANYGAIENLSDS